MKHYCLSGISHEECICDCAPCENNQKAIKQTEFHKRLSEKLAEEHKEIKIRIDIAREAIKHKLTIRKCGRAV